MTNKLRVIQHVASIGLLTLGCVGVLRGTDAIAHPVVDSPSKPIHIAQTRTLQGSWRLANMTEPPFPTPMLVTTEMTADFAGGKISGTGGCNRYFGNYSTKGSQIKIGALGSTFKACEQSVMEQESRFLKAMQQAVRYETDSNGLQIYYRNEQGEGVLRFTSQAVQGLW
jgi:heat shock protein HslJ